MPKINGKNIDPKVYAKRVTQAKKTVAAIDPAVKAKIKDMYPKKAAPKATATPKATGSMRKPSTVVKPKEQIIKERAAAAMKKPTPLKPKPKPTPLSPSEKAFLAGQKKKAQITKRTGVYPNTAN